MPLALVFPGDVLLVSAIAVVGVFVAVWIVSLAIKDVSIVDPMWGPSYVVVAIAAALAGDGDAARRYLLLVLTAAWGLRLGLHLLTRWRGEDEEDRRYQAIRARKGAAFPLYSLAAIFGTQALIVLIVSMPLQVAAQGDADLGLLAIPGVLVWAVGLAFEAIGDWQLTRFKAQPDSKGKVMDQGLWRYTRHPNYFGDACVWWGLWLVAITAGGGWWTVFAPLLMTFILTRGTGAKMLEKDIGERRPGYKEYVESTSGFLPLPPRSRVARAT